MTKKAEKTEKAETAKAEKKVPAKKKATDDGLIEAIGSAKSMAELAMVVKDIPPAEQTKEQRAAIFAATERIVAQVVTA